MPSRVETGELKAFLLASNQAGYAGGDERTWARRLTRDRIMSSGVET
jgi:hypothetical protein